MTDPGVAPGDAPAPSRPPNALPGAGVPSPLAAAVIALGAVGRILDPDLALGLARRAPPRRHWDYGEHPSFEPFAESTMSLIVPEILLGVGAIALYRVTRTKVWLGLAGIAFFSALVDALHGLPTQLLESVLDDRGLAWMVAGLGDGLLGLLAALAMGAGLLASRRFIGLPLGAVYTVVAVVASLAMLVVTLLAGRDSGDRDIVELLDTVRAFFAGTALLAAGAWLAIAAGVAPPAAPERGRALRVVAAIGAAVLMICVLLAAPALAERFASGREPVTPLVTALLLSAPGWILLAVGAIGLARGGVVAGWVLLPLAGLQVVCCPANAAITREGSRALQVALPAVNTLGLSVTIAALALCLFLCRKLGLPRLATFAGVLLALASFFLLAASAIGLIEQAEAWVFVLLDLALPTLVMGLASAATYFFLQARSPAPAS